MKTTEPGENERTWNEHENLEKTYTVSVACYVFIHYLITAPLHPVVKFPPSVLLSCHYFGGLYSSRDYVNVLVDQSEGRGACPTILLQTRIRSKRLLFPRYVTAGQEKQNVYYI